jgi:hypothetical protein
MQNDAVGVPGGAARRLDPQRTTCGGVDMMHRLDRTSRAAILAIAVFLGVIALRPFFDPPVEALAQTARFDHVFIVSAMFLYNGKQGLLVMDKRNANVWFFPRDGDSIRDPVLVTRLPFEKLDQPER